MNNSKCFKGISKIPMILIIAFFNCIFFFYGCDVHSFTFSEKIYESVSRNIPSWFYDQIEEDLNNCSLDRSIEEEYNYLQSNSYDEKLVLFRIYNNQLIYKGTPERQESIFVKRFFRFFDEMSRFIDFPNVDFILYTYDRIEEYLLDLKIPERNIPIFTISKKKNTSTGILMPHLRFLFIREKYLKLLDMKAQKIKWESKINKFFWRGSPSGFGYENHTNPRLRLVEKSLLNPDILDAAFIKNPVLLKRNPALAMENSKMSKNIEQHEQIKYKYLIAVEGNSFPSSLHWQIYSNSLTMFVDSPYIEWFYSALKPYVHYVPLKKDYTDLREKMIWLQQNDSLAKEISKNAMKFARNQISNERMIHYIYLLLCMYKEKFQTLVESVGFE